MRFSPRSRRLPCSFLSTVIIFFRQLGPKILAALGDLAGLLVQKGKDLLEGFADGYELDLVALRGDEQGGSSELPTAVLRQSH